jgi:hypothetical protein
LLTGTPGRDGGVTGWPARSHQRTPTKFVGMRQWPSTVDFLTVRSGRSRVKPAHRTCPDHAQAADTRTWGQWLVAIACCC